MRLRNFVCVASELSNRYLVPRFKLDMQKRRFLDGGSYLTRQETLRRDDTLFFGDQGFGYCSCENAVNFADAGRRICPGDRLQALRSTWGS